MQGANRIYSILLLCLGLLFPCISIANNSDCFEYSLNPNLKLSEVNDNVAQAADPTIGEVLEVCRNKFPSVGEKMTFKRVGNDVFDHSYKVEREYCWARNLFYGDKRCYWRGKWIWGLNYGATFSKDQVVDPSVASGSRALKRGTLPGHHVCLKRYIRGAKYLHDDKQNNGTKTKVCAYVVNAIAGACNSPLLNWSHALIGCVDSPTFPGPPTFNASIPVAITPYVSPSVSLLDTVLSDGTASPGYLSMGSTFDQPLIKMENGSLSGGELLLRYTRPGYRTIDTIPASGVFPSDPNSIIYYAAIDPENPSKVCACSAENCLKKKFVGCADRPTPRQSGFKIVAEYIQSADAPYHLAKVQFVKENESGKILYRDADGNNAIMNDSGVAMILNSDMTMSSNTANHPLSYLEVLPEQVDDVPVGEYYVMPNLGYYSYIKDVGYFYNTKFEANVPVLDENGVPITMTIETPDSRLVTDGCGALKVSENQDDERHPKFTILGGVRDRTYCQVCPSGIETSVCSVLPVTKCSNDVILENEVDAILGYCPGLMTKPSAIKGQTSICVQSATDWDIIDYSKDKPCVRIVTDCAARTTDVSANEGYGVWSDALTPGVAPASSVCTADYGVEQTRYYRLEPKNQVKRDDFNCSAFSVNCDQAYRSYGYAYQATLKEIALWQGIAHSLGRNLNIQEINSITAVLSVFKDTVHTIVYDEQAPVRSCAFDLDKPTVNYSEVTNGCKRVGTCAEITKAIAETGFATWDAVPALSDDDIQKTTNNYLTDFRIVVTGQCKTGYKKVSDTLDPQRECYIKYVGGQRVMEQWTDILNPCVPE